MKLSLFVSTLLISASAECTPEDPQVGEKAAINMASNYARNICRSGYFLRSKWNVRTETTNNSCVVQAEAYVSCYQ